jgi:uncharacterized protein YdeI (YjbR/CyaY-like superfamily)
MDLKFFANPAEFRKWLKRNHGKAVELWVGYYKKDTGIPSITWPESVDEALCFGWIDGLRKSIDEKCYRIRFTPRKAGSNWSEVNIRRMQELTRLGKLEPAGIRAFEGRKENAEPFSRIRDAAVLSKEFEDRLKSNTKAWEYFNALAPSFRKMSVGWVMSAKKEETRLRRLEVLIACSEKGRKVPPLIIDRRKQD